MEMDGHIDDKDMQLSVSYPTSHDLTRKNYKDYYKPGMTRTVRMMMMIILTIKTMTFQTTTFH